MTWLFPVAGLMLWRPRAFARSGAMSSAPEAPPNFSILVPAHNECASITSTIEQIRRSAARAQHEMPGLRVEIIIGADNCDDETAELASASEVPVVSRRMLPGKWRTLASLIRYVDDLDWVGLVDAGISWPEELLGRCVKEAMKPGTIAVAPSYHNPDAGVIEQVHWSIERHFKSLEGAAGGPVSIHGATVFYRARELKRVLSNAGRQVWLNDDVVVPMLLRACFPDQRIAYLRDVGVRDTASEASGRAPASELRRRLRMAVGNVQWIRSLLVPLWRQNAAAGALALRRVFRLLWAYWCLALAAALALCLNGAVGAVWTGFLTLAGLGTVLLAASIEPAVKRLTDSAWASFCAPYFLLSRASVDSEQCTWK